MPFVKKNTQSVNEEVLKELIEEQVKDIECNITEIDGGFF